MAGGSGATHGCFASMATAPDRRSDHWETPDAALDAILAHIDRSKVIWEPFYCSGRSGAHIAARGYTVHHEPVDFFTHEPPAYDVIVSNPPYSIKAAVFDRLRHLDRPFAMLLPLTTLAQRFIRTCFAEPERRRHLQLLLPATRVCYLMNGVRGKSTAFDSIWICYRLNLPHALTFA